MGRQVAIAVTRSDRDQFEDVVRGAGGVLLPSTRSSRTPSAVHSSVGVEQRFPGRFWICREAEVDSVELEYVEAQGYWGVDALNSPVVQYSVAKKLEGGVSTGRLWYEKGHFDEDDQWCCYSDEFLDFADFLFRWVRRRFVRDPESGTYCGLEAYRVLHGD